MGNPTELYLPLLNHPDPEVRHQSATLLLATYGERGLTYLRRLLDSPTPAIQTAARNALLAIADTSGIHVELRPFRGVYVRCLGELRVFLNSYELQTGDWGNEESGRAGGRKVQGLFAFLIHRGRHGATRSEIAAAVWGTEVSTVSISRTLGALRQVLTRCGSPELTSHLLISNRERIALNPAAYLCDADHFERTFELACQREDQDGLGAAQPLYHQVLSLYDGPYMEGFARGSDWGQERRDLIASSYVIAAERLAQHAYEHRSDRQCLNICRQALVLDPTDDDLTIWILRAYARQGLWVDMELAFQNYLAVAEVDPTSVDNPVCQVYASLTPPVALA
ncbi:MAG: BTAD domain-containing putative transcriptional regulator [Oscillochloridaceae bacterium umkhey_bin13]